MKTLARPRRTVFRLHSVLIGLILLATASGVASHAVDSQSRIDSDRTSSLDQMKTNSSMRPMSRRFSGWVWTPSFAPLVGETAEIFAADCTTAKTEFALGEVICAKTDGVDLTVPGNHFMNWHHPDGATTNGGTITQNPQYFLFSIPTSGANNVGTWKANIGRVSPAEPSIIGSPALFTVDESGAVATFAADCLTPKSNFVLGDIICARATGLVGYRFAWQDAAGYLEQKTDITTDPQTDTFQLPATQTSVIDGVTVDNRGQWRVSAITSRSSVKRATFLIVKDPANPVVDLSITKSRLGDNPQQGGQVQYLVRIINNGPDAAANVHFVDDTFTGATFNSVTETSGLGFICTGSGSADCTIATLPAGSQASFLLNFTAGSAGSSVQNTAEISSDTTEQNTLDNTFTTAEVVVGSGTPPPACTLNCPNNINAVANTEENSQRGAHVAYAAPVVSDETDCGAVTSTPASGSFFPVGTTTVVATSASGNGSCSFTITVLDEGNAPTVSCPPNKEVDAQGDCSVAVTVGTATATGGENVTIFATRSDGKPMYDCDVNGNNCIRRSSDAPFAGGVTTITWTATSHDASGDETGNSSCTQTITVNNANEDTTAPVITCPANITRSNDAGQCSAVINVGTASATDNCDSNPEVVGTRSDNEPLDAPYPKGTTTITWTATDASGNSSSCDQTVTVNDTENPTISCPADITRNNDPGACGAVVSYTAPVGSDNCPGATTAQTAGLPSGSTFPVGTTTNTFEVTDSSGNKTSCSFTVTVNDEEPPTITCQANITVYLAPNTTDTSAVVNYTTPAGQDNCAGATTTQQQGLASGSSFPVGTTTNIFRVTDAAGNYAECSFTVTVLYNFTGFFNPVSNPPAFNNVNAGRAIPIKFSLSGNKGLSIFVAGYPMSQQIACDSSAPLSELEGTETSGGSTLTYSPDTYHYNWKTESSWTGTCRILIVKLNDGTEHTALFKFK